MLKNQVKCETCGDLFVGNRKDAKFCSSKCRAGKMAGEFKGISMGTVGALNELRVCVDLLSKGYDVFRSVSPNCPCDLVAAKNGRLLRVEVRTVRGTDEKIYLTKPDPSRYDILAMVLPSKILYQTNLLSDRLEATEGLADVLWRGLLEKKRAEQEVSKIGQVAHA